MDHDSASGPAAEWRAEPDPSGELESRVRPAAIIAFAPERLSW
jgi:hypothetical protein